jgi:hypothetical protein
MGLHTRHPEEAGDEEPPARRSRRLGPVPLLPAVAGVMALATVVSAVSTKQISLNFAGGPPTQEPAPRTLSTESAPPLSPRSGRPARNDYARRGAARASRGADRSLVTVTFRKISTWSGGYEGQATITNHGVRPVEGWTLVARYDGTEILNVWNVLVVSTGPTLVVRNPLDHPTIAPGQRVHVSFTADGGGVLPSTCAFNGDPCR